MFKTIIWRGEVLIGLEVVILVDEVIVAPVVLLEVIWVVLGGFCKFEKKIANPVAENINKINTVKTIKDRFLECFL